MLVSESPGSVVSANSGDTQCPRETESRHPHQKRERTPFWKWYNHFSGTWYPEQRSLSGISKKDFENL